MCMESTEGQKGCEEIHDAKWVYRTPLVHGWSGRPGILTRDTGCEPKKRMTRSGRIVEERFLYEQIQQTKTLNPLKVTRFVFKKKNHENASARGARVEERFLDIQIRKKKQKILENESARVAGGAAMANIVVWRKALSRALDKELLGSTGGKPRGLDAVDSDEDDEEDEELELDAVNGRVDAEPDIEVLGAFDCPVWLAVVVAAADAGSVNCLRGNGSGKAGLATNFPPVVAALERLAVAVEADGNVRVGGSGGVEWTERGHAMEKTKKKDVNE